VVQIYLIVYLILYRPAAIVFTGKICMTIKEIYVHDKCIINNSWQIIKKL